MARRRRTRPPACATARRAPPPRTSTPPGTTLVYIHSILDRTYGDTPSHATCVTNVVPLDVLPTDLAKAPDDVRNFNVITPDLCSDGHDSPCADGRPGGLASVNAWLLEWIPKIENSAAFNKDGLIITSRTRRRTATPARAAASRPATTPRSPAGVGITSGSPGPGGGRIGTLLIGHDVAPGSTSTVPYNHYSLLRSLEDIFGITTGGSDGKGHLGYAGAAGLRSFGDDVFQAPKGNG